MARQLSGFEMNTLPVPEAYFRVGQINLNKVAKTAEVHCYIYASADARKAGQDPLPCSKVYTITGDAFDASFGTTIAEGANGAEPTAAADALLSTAYTALDSNDEAKDTLAGSTAA